MQEKQRIINCQLIKARRIELGYTLKKLEELTGIDAAALSRIENCIKTSIETNTLAKIAQALNLPGRDVLNF